MRKLIKVEIVKISKGYAFVTPGRTVTFYGDEDKLKLFLKRIQVKDYESQPKSSREKTYQEIVDGIISGNDRKVWIWSNIWNQLNTVEKIKENITDKENNMILKEGFINSIEDLVNNYVSSILLTKNLKSTGKPAIIINFKDSSSSSVIVNLDNSKKSIVNIQTDFHGEGARLFNAFAKDTDLPYLLAKAGKAIGESVMDVTVTIVTETRIPGTNIILENGDKIVVTKKSMKEAITDVNDPKFTKFLNEIDKLVERNDHTGARIVIAEFFKLKDFKIRFEAIETIANIEGYLDHNLSLYRESLTKAMFSVIKSEQGSEVSQLVYSSL